MQNKQANNQAIEGIQLIDTINLPTAMSSQTKFYLFKDSKDVISVLAKGDVSGKENVLVRVHSECLFGDLLGSLKCDCGRQLEKAKKLMKVEPLTLLFYLGQEGRGIGLKNKVKAYKLQEQGHDTIDANTLLGFKPDMRSYDSVGKILKQFFKIDSIRLLTNNPKKIEEIKKAAIAIKQIPLITPSNKHNRKYLTTKKIRFGHTI
ncbi:GTP cyclohydrolase II [Candidatus Woesearchaeota archaeon]|nr:GTP cyclohydrolase II [Candidatus Woesearchaeota archaeon]